MVIRYKEFFQPLNAALLCVYFNILCSLFNQIFSFYSVRYDASFIIIIIIIIIILGLMFGLSGLYYGNSPPMVYPLTLA